MGCTLYFIRHGQSLGNLNSIFLGHTDLDLSPLGYRQAAKTAEYLNNIHIDKVFSSDLLRAYSTCREYLKLCGKTAETDRDLREIYAGDWENKTFDVLQSQYNDTYRVWLNHIGSSHPDNGESVKHLTDRVVKCITKIAQDNDGKAIAVFTHATVIRSFFNFAYGNSPEDMKDLKWASNASVSSVVYDSGKFKVIKYSEDEFLSDLKTGLPANV